MNMPRVAHNLLAALLTFAIGVIIATFSRNILPRFAHFVSFHSTMERVNEPSKDGDCDEWQQTAAASDGLGWDLTYMPLLRNSGVCPGQLYCEFASQKPQPPVNKYLSEWQGGPLVSSMLIELPDGHAAMQALWLIRTKEKAYWGYFHPDHIKRFDMQPLPTQDYDRAFETMKCWQQQNPANRKFFEGRGDGDGYVGFLSLYEDGKSRQMLVSSSDLLDPWTNELNEIQDEARWGRLWKTLKPIYAAIEQQKKAIRVSE